MGGCRPAASERDKGARTRGTMSIPPGHGRQRSGQRPRPGSCPPVVPGNAGTTSQGGRCTYTVAYGCPNGNIRSFRGFWCLGQAHGSGPKVASDEVIHNHRAGDRPSLRLPSLARSPLGARPGPRCDVGPVGDVRFCRGSRRDPAGLAAGLLPRLRGAARGAHPDRLGRGGAHAGSGATGR